METRQELTVKGKTDSRVKITLKGSKSDDKFFPLVDTLIEIPEQDKKIYVMLKGRDTLPATVDDIARLTYIKDNNKDRHSNYEYMIFCERDGNKRTEDIARNFGITYISRNIDFESKLNEYFDGR
ncbi:MAG: hypothetical protein K8823_1387 [Cenarchaeum symbiont of Oopsacas minuta]|nr:hypothetical protein [Cenarchaeum symbiont of Oopsacas minuta]